MKLVDANHKLTLGELKTMAQKMFGNFVKGVVDIEQESLVVDVELHVDAEQLLLEQGSKQENLWGINLYPDRHGNDFIEYDSMINLRPAQNNRTRSVENPAVRAKIAQIVNQLVEK